MYLYYRRMRITGTADIVENKFSVAWSNTFMLGNVIRVLLPRYFNFNRSQPGPPRPTIQSSESCKVLINWEYNLK